MRSEYDGWSVYENLKLMAADAEALAKQAVTARSRGYWLDQADKARREIARFDEAPAELRIKRGCGWECA